MNLTLPQLVQFAQGAGFSGSSANTAAAIAMAESGGNPFAVNYSDPGGSYGLTQINAGSWGSTAANTLGNPAEAFSQMFNISLGGTNFTPWSTFNSGTYLPFLNQLTGSQAPLDAGGVGSLVGSSLGSQPVTDALGNQSSSSSSPMSRIFDAVNNFFQRAGFIFLGIILIAIGTYFVARPQVEGAARKVAAAAAA